MQAVETRGRVDKEHRLHVDEPLPITGPAQVRVLVLVDDEAEAEEREWLAAAAANPAFDFLNEPAEDIYTPDDGKPFRDQR